jgi:hypothetical protein
MLNQSKNCNLNYSAQVVELKNKIQHPNADRLIGWTVQGCNVWTSSDYKEGDVCVFFPLESQISTELISYLSLFRKSEYNQNKGVTGFFELKGRVKALKLRGAPSEGFLLKIESLRDFIKSKFNKDLTYEIGEVFDSFEDFQICKKYVIRHIHAGQGQGNNKQKRKALNLVENQFRLHYDTAKLAVHDYVLNPGDICVITSKWHGTSFVSSKLLVNRKLSILEKIAKFLGCKVQETKYDYVYSSRKVIKAVGEQENSNQHYYSEDIWKLVHNDIKEHLQNGMSVYGEIVGYLPDGKMIQKDYDYGCNTGQYQSLVYRITSTNTNGEVFEWDWASIKNWCVQNGIKHVPEYYYGPVNFTLEQLKEKYLEKDCEFCVNKVPSEGICFRNESKNKIAFKLKSFRFLKRETEELDAGIIDLESQEGELDEEN